MTLSQACGRRQERGLQALVPGGINRRLIVVQLPPKKVDRKQEGAVKEGRHHTTDKRAPRWQRRTSTTAANRGTDPG